MIFIHDFVVLVSFEDQRYKDLYKKYAFDLCLTEIDVLNGWKEYI